MKVVHYEIRANVWLDTVTSREFDQCLLLSQHPLFIFPLGKILLVVLSLIYFLHFFLLLSIQLPLLYCQILWRMVLVCWWLRGGFDKNTEVAEQWDYRWVDRVETCGCVGLWCLCIDPELLSQNLNFLIQHMGALRHVFEFQIETF